MSHINGKCPAMGRTCSIYQKPNHFAKMCKGKDPKAQQKPSENTGPQKRIASIRILQVGRRSRVPQISVEISDLATGARLGKIFAVPDSGAEATVTGLDVIHALGIHEHNLKCKSIDGLVAANDLPMDVIGEIDSTIALKGRSTTETIIISPRQKGLLLSWTACKELGILPEHFPEPIKLRSIQESDKAATDAQRTMLKQQLLTEFDDVFSEEGNLVTMNGPPMKIELRENATPYAVNGPRPIPYAQREEVKRMLDEMEQSGIISPVTEPSEWTHPLVVVQKPKGGIHICAFGVRDTDFPPANLSKYGRVHFQPSDAPRITKSKTSLELFHPKGGIGPQGTIVVPLMSSQTPPSDSTLKRSKSVGSHADMLLHGEVGDLKWSKWTPEAESTLKKALQDPQAASARVLMDAVRIILNKAVESSQFAVPAARLCITIIEKEKRETFLESLLNTCQEWFRERERLLRPVVKNVTNSGTGTPRWLGFIAFLNEMYLQLKRRQLHLTTQCDGVPPCLMLLSLLAECCNTGFQPQTSYNSAEVECLFFVLMAIGRDLEQEIPAKMSVVMNGVRDAFLAQATPPNVKKTLLQLVELQGARWQLPAQALMYYHPSSGNFGH